MRDNGETEFYEVRTCDSKKKGLITYRPYIFLLLVCKEPFLGTSKWRVFLLSFFFITPLTGDMAFAGDMFKTKGFAQKLVSQPATQFFLSTIHVHTLPQITTAKKKKKKYILSCLRQ